MINIYTRRRLLKKVGFRISELGLGAWGIGGRNVGSETKIDPQKTVEAYVQSGGNFIDTAISYGDSEKTIGRVLAQLGCLNDVFICSKSKKGETEDNINQLRADLEQTLRNLQREYVDIFYLHMPPEDSETIYLALNEMEKFKKEGKIRAVGASIKGPAVTQNTVDLVKTYVDTKRIDVIQLVYSILRQKNLESIQYAFDHDVGIVVRTCFESGFLTGKYSVGKRFASDDHRSRWNSQIDGILTKVNQIKHSFTSEKYNEIGQIAIQFVLHLPEVTSVIIGAKNTQQLFENIKASLMERLSKEEVEQLRKEYWDFWEYANPKTQ